MIFNTLAAGEWTSLQGRQLFWLGRDPGKDEPSLPPSGLEGNDKGSKTTPQKAGGDGDDRG